MGHGANLDYPDLAKYSTLASFVLLLLGAAGTTFGAGGLPGWELTVLLDLEILGVLGIVVCPFVFGIALPLTE